MYHSTAGQVTPRVKPNISRQSLPYSRAEGTVGEFVSCCATAKRNPDRYRELGMPVVFVKYRRWSGKMREKLGRLVECLGKDEWTEIGCAYNEWAT